MNWSNTRFWNYTENNEWDDAGNATTYRDVERAFNDDNQIDVYGFEYDGNGNPTTYNGQSATYNANNQLTSFGSHFEAGYRADGLRAYKHWEDTETEDPPAEWTYYLYDGGNAVCELDESGNLLSTNIYAPDGLVAKRMADGTTGSYLFDLQGNTAEIITGSGVKVNAAYNAWGQCNYMNPVPFPNDPFMQHAYNARWGYLGDETGLYYCQNRYYDPGTGRFLTRDPISYSGGMNLYGYCGGGPVGAADPSGLQSAETSDVKNQVILAEIAEDTTGIAPAFPGTLGAVGRTVGEFLAGLERGLSEPFPGILDIPMDRDDGNRREFDLYRVVEPPEECALAATGGIPSLQPGLHESKQFFLSERRARKYQSQAHSWGFIKFPTRVWRFKNPDGVGYLGEPVDFDPEPTWFVPGPQLPRLRGTPLP